MKANTPVPDGQEIKVQGKRIRTLEELLDRIEEISKASYERYVNEDKNELADWVSKQDKSLAKKMRKVKTKKEMTALLRHEVLKHYEAKALELEEEDDYREVGTEFGDFMVMEFVYGAMFGFVLALIIMGVINSLG